MVTKTGPRAVHAVLILPVIVAGHLLGLGSLPPQATPSRLASLPELAPAGGDFAPRSPVPVASVSAAPAPLVLPTSPEQWFNPSGRNQGTEGLARFLAAVALHDNTPLYLSDTWGRTTGSEQSDHHTSRSDSWACDVAVLGIQVPTPATELAAKRVAAALGVPNWGGGDLTMTVNGYRFQILWRVAGHFNHVHIGVRKVA